MNAKWIRVKKKDPCKICGRADWCTYSLEIGLALCMRVESERPSNNSMGGWIHKIGEGYVRSYTAPRRLAIEPPPLDAAGMWKRWFEETDFHHLDGFGQTLGVDTDALRLLGCAWGKNAWAFPMKNAKGQVIGIRLRNEAGQKWAVKGSKQGIFIPEEQMHEGSILYIVEGPTDAAAALTLGLRAIGRPSCMGCDEMIVDHIRLQGIKRAVVVTDSDEPGLRGAEKLQRVLPVFSAIWVPPCKDLREFLTAGGNTRIIEATLKDTVWTPAAQLSIQSEAA